jgi:hypothetical protein
MPTRHRDGGDGFGAQFVRELAKLFGLELAKVGGKLDRVEQRCVRSI